MLIFLLLLVLLALVFGGFFLFTLKVAVIVAIVLAARRPRWAASRCAAARAAPSSAFRAPVGAVPGGLRVPHPHELLSSRARLVHARARRVRRLLQRPAHREEREQSAARERLVDRAGIVGLHDEDEPETRRRGRA